ncbi:pyridoxamine 5'-phosphate oxidase family protein [Jiella sp. MQZ9-1]|uniref:Pyridoxamine 5'-phosphate oxidase family protein n=1 Tax=Jiella flava TaxID=2816857 RepID=A0A939FXP8_9HYPH|nr:pyridoxamine 5'-phosphate oxidase family protein [Jiella flava]MBO0661442.1 pyridoxamine 5'-phosphate oxidase family protein [Jiella flava]MCD2470085.1 pyridoxamine 5'-phosphate oxidase family protein [Jiella flava]
MSDTLIRSIDQLEALYGEPLAPSLAKVADHLTPHYRALVEASPFVLVASVGPEGLDCSPRGDPAGFVAIDDEATLLLPDRLGNNRADTLKNIVRDPRVALLFLIPGIGETLRVNGRAEIDIASALLERFAINGKRPRSVIRIRIETVYFQCQKALVRSRLWDASRHVDRKSLPSAGDMLAERMAGFDGASYDAHYPERLKQTIY